MNERDGHGGITTVAGVREAGEKVLAAPDKQRSSKFDDLLLDTVAGIANGAEDDPVAMCRAICEVGARYTGDPAMWLTWDGAAIT